MPLAFFTSDLHGSVDRYQKLYGAILSDIPKAVFLGGDLLPSGIFSTSRLQTSSSDFISDFLAEGFTRLKREMGDSYPRIFLILGNDDPRSQESAILEFAEKGLWEYMHLRKAAFEEYDVYGYGYVPPTPFLLKDWERYDVSRYIEPGDVSPEEGFRSVSVTDYEKKYETIKRDLTRLASEADYTCAIFLFHTPPYKTALDIIEADDRPIDGVPRDSHQGSIAVRNLIETKQPLVTLHGHIHESCRLSGKWMDRLGKTVMITGAHDGPELALVRFDPAFPHMARRELL